MSNETPAEMTTVSLSAMKLPELKALAASRGLKGISQLRKPQLIELLSNDASAPTTQEAAPGEETPASSSDPSSSDSSSSGSSSGGSAAVSGDDAAIWAAIAQCESGGNPSTNTGNGYYGMYQFSLPTWQSVGGTGLPSDASAEEQTMRARMLQQRAGWGQWGCAYKLGLV